MNWAKVVFQLGEMRGRSLVQADLHSDPFYQKQHQDRAAMCDTLEEVLRSGLSEDEVSELVELQDHVEEPKS